PPPARGAGAARVRLGLCGRLRTVGGAPRSPSLARSAQREKTMMTAGTLLSVEGVPAVNLVDVGPTQADLVVGDLELQHGQALFGFVRRQGLADVEAQDAIQDALFRLWLELRSGTTIENPRAWAYRAVYRIAMDHHRLRAR